MARHARNSGHAPEVGEVLIYDQLEDYRDPPSPKVAAAFQVACVLMLLLVALAMTWDMVTPGS